MTPKRLTNFRIDSELLEGLEAIRTRDGIPVSEQVRRAIRSWLESKGVEKKTERLRGSTPRKRPLTRKQR